jgi:uncharacterized membrane protein
VNQAKVSKKQAGWGLPAKSEPTWPATLAITFTILIHLYLPDQFTFGPRWLLPVVLSAVIIPVSILSPRRTANESRYRQWIAVVVIGLVSLMNGINLVMLMRVIILNPKATSGTDLIVGSIGIWLTNVIVFGLWYWEIDRGGPDDRLRADHSPPDLLFPQMATPAAAPPGWCPRFIDYLYVAFTNATAFSPTDTMPLTARMKSLFLVQSLISLLTVTFVAARAVNILN